MNKLSGSGYANAVKEVMVKANDGFKLSELKGLRLAVAKRLIDAGRLNAFPIPGGDFIVNKK